MMRKSLTVIAFVFLAIVSCYQPDQTQTQVVELPDQIVDNFQMEETQSGKQLYALNGNRAFYYNKSARIVVMDPEIEFYNPDKVVVAHVVCDSGVVLKNTGDLYAYGKVVVLTEDSTELRTDSLVWFNRRAQIETDAPVHITSTEGTIDGKGLISDANLDKIVIKEEVSGTTKFSVESGE